jgi:hypothetical protein
VSATATLPHPDRLTTRERPTATPAADVDLAVEHLATLIAGHDGDPVEALEAVARAAARLARRRLRRVHLDEERPVAAIGSWSLDQGMLPQIVLGED